jgi:acyl carrier protein
MRTVPTDTDDIVDGILGILAVHGQLSIETTRLGDHDNLFHAGMTSHASVTVMLALESQFGIEFPEHMLRRSTFESVSSIRAAVDELLTNPVKNDLLQGGQRRFR